ncbi:hypothetical protein ACFWPX_14165 [Nocardia sp. NPDC058518]|uniref:hypothetical protein n=1 Tax=Nocardia sp. NPDC058518 TaxID=3346534 RepID=UPI00366855FD
MLAVVYTVASIFLGPAIFLGGYAFTRGGGDYCDGSYGGGVYSDAPSVGKALRDAEFRTAQVFQVAGAGIMLAVGLLLLTYLWAYRHRIDRPWRIVSSVGIITMMVGYGLVIAFSGGGGQVCSIGG